MAENILKDAIVNQDLISSEDDFVSFETAKALKECGYAQHFGLKYSKSGIISKGRIKDNGIPCANVYHIVKWIMKKYSVYISVYPLSLGWYFEIYDMNRIDITGAAPIYKAGIPCKENVLSTMGRAYDAGIKYFIDNVKNNLINEN